MSESCRKASFSLRSARHTTRAPALWAPLTKIRAALSSRERLENLVLRLTLVLLMTAFINEKMLRGKLRV